VTEQKRIDNVWLYGLRYREPRLLLISSLVFIVAPFALRLPLSHVLLHATIASATWFLIIEYFFHRFGLHIPQDKLTWFTGLHVHWRHHRAPNDVPLIFTPWWALLLLLGGTALVGSLTEGVVSSVGATLGMSVTVFFYETTHMSSHVPYVPKTKYGQYMRRFHLWHHFQNEHYWFGVTHPLLDGVFGTWKRSKEVERSPTARTLGVDS
jgi:sterol desaturase/sphingolipid hydroxylase (fatty acid hydroxylase superfamily)